MIPSWFPVLSGLHRGLLYVNHEGLSRLEAEHEESTVHMMVWNPNLSLSFSLQCEERLIHMDSSPSPFRSGTWNPGAHMPYINFSSSLPSSVALSLPSSPPPFLKTNHHKIQIIMKGGCVLRGHQSSKDPVSLGEAEKPIPLTPPWGSNPTCFDSHLGQPWRRAEQLAFST